MVHQVHIKDLLDHEPFHLFHMVGGVVVHHEQQQDKALSEIVMIEQIYCLMADGVPTLDGATGNSSGNKKVK